MALRFSTASQLNSFQGVKIFTYAESGAGKTVLTATAPSPILLSAESGTLSLSRANLEKIFGVANPTVTYDMPVIQISTLEELTEAYNWLTGSEEARRFETVNVDSLTEIAEVVLANAKKLTKDPRQAYGELIDKMIMLVKAFRDLQGKNVFMSCKLEAFKDEFTGITKYGPAMPGTKVGPQLPYLFDEVFYLGRQKTQDGAEYRYIQTEMDIQRVAKDRSGALLAVEEPNLTKIIAKIRGNI